MAIIYDLTLVPEATRKAILKSKKFRKWFSEKPGTMLRLDGSTKVIKGNKLGYRTAILYLSPAKSSGVNVCAMAKLAACSDACLNTAGRGAMTGVQMSRLRKTLFFIQFQQEAVIQIKREVAMFEARSSKQGWTLLIRLNGTSDIRWERYGIIQAYPSVQFYDYTKLANRKDIPTNYDLTFSYSGVAAYQSQVKIALEAGMRIAVVFAKQSSFPDRYLDRPVVDGDDTDIRHIDSVHSVVALYAKGKAKQDRSGFVVR